MAAGGAADGDQRWLVECLTATLDTARDVRAFAEESLRQASLLPGTLPPPTPSLSRWRWVPNSNMGAVQVSGNSASRVGWELPLVEFWSCAISVSVVDTVSVQFRP